MVKTFKVGDHVSRNSEAGRVRGKIVKMHRRNVTYKGYVHRASPDELEHEIKSDITDLFALHKAAVRDASTNRWGRIICGGRNGSHILHHRSFNALDRRVHSTACCFGNVVDVRTVPRSRTNPGILRSASASLSASQIAYEHIAELGGLRMRAFRISHPAASMVLKFHKFHNSCLFR